MEKAKDFLPSLHTRGFLQIENVTPIDSGLPYISAREKEALTLPRRSSDYSRLFAPHRTSDRGNYFQKPVGQEFDQFDEVLKKYMTSPERGLKKPLRDRSTGMTIKVDKNSAFLEGTSGIFVPASLYPDFLQNTKPLLDRTNTPRGA